MTNLIKALACIPLVFFLTALSIPFCLLIMGYEAAGNDEMADRILCCAPLCLWLGRHEAQRG